MKFSIITISYNSSKTIERTILSVLNQTNKDYEYIIVDGLSKDNTIDIVKSYEPRFEGRMRWISEPDNGIYNAMNKGIKMAKGDIIGIVNSDDWLEADTLEVLSNVIHENPDNINKILTGDMMFHYADGTKLLISTSYQKYESLSKQLRMGLNHPATFVPKSIYNTIGLFDERFKLYADADFFIRCYESKVDVLFINKVLSNMLDGGASNKLSKLMIEDSLLNIKLHSKTQLERIWRIIRYYCILTTKYMVPDTLLKKYRALHS